MTTTTSSNAGHPEEAGPGGNRGWLRRARFRRLRQRLVLAAAFGWALFLLAHLVLTGRWWLWMFIEPMPPFLLVAVPAALLLLVPFARAVAKPVALLLVATLAIGVPLAGFPTTAGTQPAQAATGGQSVKVFAWNTGYWHSGTGYLDYGGDIDSPQAFYAYLHQQNADVYLLSEHLFWRGGPIALDDHNEIQSQFPDYEVNVEGELVTLSRVPVAATHPRAVGENSDDWYWRGNKAQRTDLRVGGCILSVYNVHIPQPIDPRLNPLTAKYYSFAHGQYNRQQRELEALRDDIDGNANPLLVAGDFNSPWMGSLVQVGDDLRRWNPGNVRGLPVTFPAADTGWSLPKLWRLDWTFTRGPVQLSDYRLRQSPRLSDHLAQDMTASVRCQPAARERAAS
ncbi:endonuclease/exonuclease/phosphatase family protein [Micromonospora sp. NPDC049171]|uniref:endonuclease/exonuclease/phosphatase family protein n=1 Tax=Micromonospora sp. NPDC049171 TaxID=3155770 RepID=UPI00340024EC